MDCSRFARGLLAEHSTRRRRSLALLAVGLLIILVTPAAARKPVVAYVDASSGVFSLYDAETATSLSAPTLPTGIARYSMSSDGRYIAYSHPSTHAIHLFDREAGGEMPLPGIDVVANPGSLSVSDTGLIAFDDNGNGPARVYDSLTGAFLATGLSTSNGHRQTRLSADGKRLAATCLGGFAGSPCAADLGSDGAVFVQDLVLGIDTGFPDDVAVAGELSENRPCVGADGSLVGFDAFAGGATGNNVYLYSRVLATLVPLPALQTAAAERDCALDVDGSYVGVMDNDGNARVYDRTGAAFLTLPSSLDGLSAPIWLTQPLQIRPETRIVSGPDGVVSSTSATFSFDSPNVPAATFRCTLDGVIENPCTSPRTYANLSQGQYTFTVTARDGGLEDLSPASRSWTVDTSPAKLPVPPRGPPARQPHTTSATALEATNALMALPWAGLAKQTMDGYPDRDREPRTLADASGKKKVAGVNVHWSLWLKGRSITPFADIRQPPGFSVLEPRRVKLEVPRKGGWKFGWDGELAARARLKVGGETVFSWSPKVGLGVELSDFKLTADAKLDATEPARPVLDRTTLTARARIRGRGAVPVNIPVSFAVKFKQRKLVLTGDFTGFKIDLGSRNARVAGELVVEVLPTERPFNVDFDVGSLKGKAVGPNLSVGFADVRVSLNGTLKITLPRVGERSMGFKLGWRTGLIPTNEQLVDMLDLISPPRPRSHGEGRFEPFEPAPGGGYRTVADDFESNLGAFLPWDGVLSRTWQTLQPPVLNQYAVEADSAIWTGHLLAAESYRWAASPPAEREPALERIGQLMTGLERMFRVTQDAVTVRVKKLVPGTPTPDDLTPPPRVVVEEVQRPVDPGRAGIFARVVRRDGSAEKIGPPLNERDCYYEWAEGGWALFAGRVRKGKVATFREAHAFLKANDGATARPTAPVWHGWGCAENHPLSRDQYAGVALGLATVHQLVDDQAIRGRAKAMVDKLLGNLLRHGWNVVLPPKNEAPMSSSFLGQWEKQLALLLVGSKVNPQRFAGEYERYRAAAANAWLPLWASALDPITQYYKFNLSHAWATMLMTYETDPGARAGYEYQHDVLRRATRHHRNAYFDLIRVLAAPPDQRAGVRDGASDAIAGVTMVDQIRSTLAEYLTRRTNQAGPLGRPTNATSNAAATFQHGLWPSRVKRFVAFDGTPVCLATSALPVWARGGERQDFVWQKDPFSLAADENACPQRGIGGAPSVGSLMSKGASPRREGPGVDYLLAYWMAVHLGVLPPGA